MHGDSEAKFSVPALLRPCLLLAPASYCLNGCCPEREPSTVHPDCRDRSSPRLWEAVFV